MLTGGVEGVVDEPTVTVTVAVLVPPEFAAVRVYCVAAVGATTFEVSEVTSPTPLLMVIEVAPETLQESVDT
jgi:hypothetical protein